LARCAACGKELGDKEGYLAMINKETGQGSLVGRREQLGTDMAEETSSQYYTCLVHEDCFVKLFEKGPPQKAGCFIATAAYGSPLANEVKTLREFRDHILLPRAWGRAVIRFYERYSLPFARIVSSRREARWLVQLGLRPLLGMLPKNSNGK